MIQFAHLNANQSHGDTSECEKREFQEADDERIRRSSVSVIKQLLLR